MSWMDNGWMIFWSITYVLATIFGTFLNLTLVHPIIWRNFQKIIDIFKN